MAEKTFILEIIMPDRIFYEGNAVMIELNTTEGEVGVYADHIPMIMIIAPGMLRITEPEGRKEIALSSGFMEIRREGIRILAEN